MITFLFFILFFYNGNCGYLRCVGMLCNVLGMLDNVLGRARHALQRPRHTLQCPWPTSACFLQGPRSLTSKRNPSPLPPHLLPYKLWSQGSSVPPSFIFGKVLGVPHWRETPPPHLLPYKLWSQGSSVPPSFISGSLVVHYFLGFIAYKVVSGGVSLRCGTLRTLQKHAEVGQGCCQACLGRCKACWGRPKTLPSMPKTLQSMPKHALGTHNYIFKSSI